MKLYEINQQLEDLFLRLEPDPETGEIPSDEEGIIAEINALAMKREDILRYLAKMTLNYRAEAEALKTEKDRLKKRCEMMTAKEERLIRILDRECGETTDLGVAVLSYRTNKRVEVSDEEKAVAWLKRHKYTYAYKVPAPTVYKEEVRKLLNAGQKIPGCSVVENRSCCLR